MDRWCKVREPREERICFGRVNPEIWDRIAQRERVSKPEPHLRRRNVLQVREDFEERIGLDRAFAVARRPKCPEGIENQIAARMNTRFI